MKANDLETGGAGFIGPFVAGTTRQDGVNGMPPPDLTGISDGPRIEMDAEKTSSLPPVTAVIVNNNRRDDTLACLETLAQQTYPSLAVIVLDNASTDGSAIAIEIGYPSAQVVPLKGDKGAAGNNNTGIRMALEQGAGWVLMLSEDALLAPDCVERMVKTGEEDRWAGIIGPMVYHAGEPERIYSAGGVMTPRWKFRHAGWNQPDSGQFPAIRPVDWVSGCALLIRCETVHQIGMLDERFFHNKWETEWCLRARRAGWNVLHVPAAKAWRKRPAPGLETSPLATYYNTRNSFLFFRKHRAPLGVRLLQWLGALRTLANWTINPRLRGKREHRDAMLLGLRDYLAGRWEQRQGPGRPGR